MEKADIGVIGLGTMGANLALNISDKGYRLCVYNRTYAVTDEFLQQHGQGREIIAAQSPDELLANLKSPRVILLMVTAGNAVDAVISSLQPKLDSDDIIIDGGNSNYQDSGRRWRELAAENLHFVGMGVSGGESGARHGPSLMPGGAVEAWPVIQEMFETVAAKVNDEPCCHWLGEGGAGHYVKMVHNGIEYGDMQLIAETCHLMLRALGMPHAEVADIFSNWNTGKLESYLIEITADIFRVKDSDDAPLVEKILDRAGQKGTGLWTAMDALEHAVPLTLITEAVHARMLSARKAERLTAAKILGGQQPRKSREEQENWLNALHQALYAAKVVSYAQGFMLLREADAEYQWQLPYAEIAKLWRAGCIIRSRFLNDISNSFSQKTVPSSLLQDDYFAKELKNAEPGWRQATILAIEKGVAAPALSSALAFYDGYRCANGSANILQAQRDYFGAHGYQRVDKDESIRFHTDWLGDGSEEAIE